MLRVVQVVHQQRCNGHCLCDCPAQQLKEQLHSAQVAGQWRGDTALTLPLFWRRSTVSPVFFGRFPRSSQSPCPLPTLSPSLIGHPASVDVKQHESQRKHPLNNYALLRVPGEIKREVELDPQVSPEEIMSREVELGCESWTSFASGCSSTAVQRTLSL